jgi:hypothetical protein
VLDQIYNALLGSRCHRGTQDSLANAASHLGLGVDDREHIVPHDVPYIRRALLDRDARLAWILCMDDKGPRIPNGCELAFSSTLSFGSLDDNLALMNELRATLKDQFDALDVLVANLDHLVCSMRNKKPFPSPIVWFGFDYS